MNEFIKMLANMKVRDLSEFERAIDVLPYAQIVEVNISLRAMIRAAKAKQNSVGMPSVDFPTGPMDENGVYTPD